MRGRVVPKSLRDRRLRVRPVPGVPDALRLQHGRRTHRGASLHGRAVLREPVLWHRGCRRISRVSGLPRGSGTDRGEVRRNPGRRRALEAARQASRRGRRTWLSRVGGHRPRMGRGRRRAQPVGRRICPGHRWRRCPAGPAGRPWHPRRDVRRAHPDGRRGARERPGLPAHGRGALDAARWCARGAHTPGPMPFPAGCSVSAGRRRAGFPSISYSSLSRASPRFFVRADGRRWAGTRWERRHRCPPSPRTSPRQLPGSAALHRRRCAAPAAAEASSISIRARSSVCMRVGAAHWRSTPVLRACPRPRCPDCAAPEVVSPIRGKGSSSWT